MLWPFANFDSQVGRDAFVHLKGQVCGWGHRVLQTHDSSFKVNIKALKGYFNHFDHSQSSACTSKLLRQSVWFLVTCLFPVC